MPLLIREEMNRSCMNELEGIFSLLRLALLGIRLYGGLLFLGPLVEQFFCLRLAELFSWYRGSKFEHVAVGVPEVNRFHDIMVSNTTNLHAEILTLFLESQKRLFVNLERNVQIKVVLLLEIKWHVSSLEKGNAGTIPHLVERMQHLGASSRLGGSDGESFDEGKPEEVLIELSGLLAVLTAVSSVVEVGDVYLGHCLGFCWHSKNYMGVRVG